MVKMSKMPKLRGFNLNAFVISAIIVVILLVIFGSISQQNRQKVVFYDDIGVEWHDNTAAKSNNPTGNNLGNIIICPPAKVESDGAINPGLQCMSHVLESCMPKNTLFMQSDGLMSFELDRKGTGDEAYCEILFSKKSCDEETLKNITDVMVSRMMERASQDTGTRDIDYQRLYNATLRMHMSVCMKTPSNDFKTCRVPLKLFMVDPEQRIAIVEDILGDGEYCE